MSSSSPIARAEVHFTGRVQGVGFRYSVLQVAKGYEISGFVENLADGRVLLMAEGEKKEVDEFVAAVIERLDGFIRKMDRSDFSGVRLHAGFEIR